MRRSSRKRSDGLDPQRVVAAAVQAFLDGEPDQRRAEADDGHLRRRGGAVAIGVVVGIGARALYRRARAFDLEQAARALEQRIKN